MSNLHKRQFFISILFVAIRKVCCCDKVIVDYCELCGIMLVNKNEILCFCVLKLPNKVQFPLAVLRLRY